MRLGFAVKVLGRKGLKSHDARRWQNSPHLRVSIEYLHKIFDYLEETKISMYRMSSELARYLTHPDYPQFYHQLEEAHDELIVLGKRAKQMNLRLSFHPSQYILLNSPGEELTRTSIRDLEWQSRVLDTLGQNDDAVVVTHVGGVYGERDAARQRFIERYHGLPDVVKRRLVLENDDTSWGVDDVLRIHEATGIRCIFDHQHHGCINPDGRDAVEACCVMLRTWDRGKPKIHFSTPRVEDRIIERRDKATGKIVKSSAAPLATQHADMIDAGVFVPFARAVRQKFGSNEIPFDVMVEAKSKDLAVLQLRDDLRTMAPEIVVE